jgi:hypothetical protein
MLSTLAVYFSRYPSHELAKSKERTQAQFKTFVAFLAAIQRVDAPVSHGKSYPPALLTNLLASLPQTEAAALHLAGLPADCLLFTVT